MLTLLINESNPLDGLFASSTTGGIGTVPDITVADDGQAVSVQSFTRAGGIITDSFVAGDVLHIGIGDGVNAPVCYVALSSASPAVGTMPINTDGMVALFAATAANQLSLTLAVVRTRGAYTNTIFSAPIVIRRSAINISTAVPTPSILGTGVAAALQIAINTALGFVRLDASARYPALDGSQITNIADGSLTVATTAIASGTTARVLYDNAGVLGEYAISGTGSVAMTTSPSFTAPTISSGTESAPSLSFTSDTNTGMYRPAADTVGIVGGGNDVVRMTGIASATDYLEIKNGIGVGSPIHVLAEGASANIGVHLQPKGSGLFTISDGTDFNKGIRFRSSSSAASAITLLDAVSTAGRVITLPDATGTLALVSGDLGTPASGDFSTGAFAWPTFDQNTTGSAATLATTRTIGGSDFNGSADVTSFPAPGPIGGTTPNTIAGTTGTFSGELKTTGAAAYLATYGAAAQIYTDGTNAYIYTSGTNASIFTGGSNAHIYTGSSGAYIQTRSTFKLKGATFVTTLSHAATANRAIAFPDAEGTLALVSGDLGTPSAVVLTNATGTAAGLTAGNATKWTTGRTIALTGDVTYTSGALDGSGNVTGTATLANIPALSGANLTTLNASNISSGTLADARNTVSNTTTTSMANLATVGTLTGGATGAGFTVALSTSTITGTLAAARGGTGVSNTGTITLGGNLVTTGAFNTTFAQAATTTVTLPATSATMARTDAAQTFTGTQTFGAITGTGQLAITTSSGIAFTCYSTAAGGAAMTLQNSSATGYSAFDVNDNAGTLKTGFGYANASAGSSPSLAYIYLNSVDFVIRSSLPQFYCSVAGLIQAKAAGTFGFSSTTSANGTADTALSRDSAGVIAFGTGAAASLAGSWKATNGTLSGTLAVTGATTLSAALITTPEALAPALNAGAACGVTTVASGFALNGTNALTLANGTNGQIKTIVCTAVTAAGTATLTPTTCSGFTTVAFTAAGQTLTLQYFTTGGWHLLSVRGATPA